MTLCRIDPYDDMKFDGHPAGKELTHRHLIYIRQRPLTMPSNCLTQMSVLIPMLENAAYIYRTEIMLACRRGENDRPTFEDICRGEGKFSLPRIKAQLEQDLGVSFDSQYVPQWSVSEATEVALCITLCGCARLPSVTSYRRSSLRAVRDLRTYVRTYVLTVTIITFITVCVLK